MQLMVFVAASDFNHSSDPTFQSDQFGEGQNRTILPSTPVPDHVSGGLSSCWSLCEAVVSAYFEPVFSGTTNTESHSAILHHSALFQGKGWAGSPLCHWCLQWYLASVKTRMVTLAHCPPYLETTPPQLVLNQKEKEGRREGNIKYRSWSI